MGFFRSIAAFILTSVFFSSLLLVAYGWTFNETVANSSAVKGWVEKSGSYNNFVSELVKTSAEQNHDDESSLDTETLLSAADQSFTPPRLQENFENLLDGAYNWLDGRAEKIRFTIDFRDEIDNFRTNIVSSAESRLNSLPVCEFAAVNPQVDPFKADCLPREADVDALIDDFKRQSLDEDFSPVDSVITETSLQEDSDDSIEDQAAFLPTAWQIAKLGAVLAIATAIISAGLLYLIATNKRKLLTRFARGFFFGALTLGIFTFFTSRSDSWLENIFSQDESASSFASNVIQPIVNLAVDDITFWTFRFFIAYLSVALLLFFLYYYHGWERLRHRKVLFKEPPEHLEKHYRKIAQKKPKRYKTINDKRRNALKKKVTKTKTAKK